jgi:hypothetical protein
LNEEPSKALIDEVFGLRPGDRLAAPVTAARPGWSRPLQHMAWSWLNGWAEAQDGAVVRRVVCCVPVWHALAEDDLDVAWQLGMVAVEEAGLLVLRTEPGPTFEGIAEFTVDVTLAVRVVVGNELPWGTPVTRQLGPYAVVRKRVALDQVGEVQWTPVDIVEPPPLAVEPWTQQVALAVPVETVPELFRGSIEELVKSLSDV